MARKSTATKNANAVGSSATRQKSARVRMYRTGLGDCFLLTFPKADGSMFHMLVDCGVFYMSPNEKKIMRDVVADIRTTTGGTIDVVVGTHEHYDHLIGFKHAKDIFEGMTIREVWLSWIDKPGDRRAAWLRALENKLKLGLQLALKQAFASSKFAADAVGLESLLQFGGNPLAADYSEQLGDVKRWLRDDIAPSVKFLEPHGEAIDLLPGVRVYPLGPPLKKEFFRKMNDSKRDRETYDTGFAFSAVPAFLSARVAGSESQVADTKDAHELALPLESQWQISEAKASKWRVPLRSDQQSNKAGRGEAFFAERYGFDDDDDDDKSWRRIDNDWLEEAENLAMQLDSLTNNSSLALAIEVGTARRVILMAADAQVGNWLSWHESTWTTTQNNGESLTVSAADLLGRTVLYKVGHHGSHNATLKKKGLEMMTSDELVAMIPVNQDFANNVKKWPMPFPGLMSELTTRAKGRVIRADRGLPPQAEVSASVRQEFFAASSETQLYSEYFVPM